MEIVQNKDGTFSITNLLAIELKDIIGVSSYSTESISYDILISAEGLLGQSLVSDITDNYTFYYDDDHIEVVNGNTICAVPTIARKN